MKNRIISAAAAVILGLAISLGPQFIFKVCEPMGNRFMTCHWSARAEIGVGEFIALLGLFLLLCPLNDVRLGVSVAICGAGFLALSIPHALIGGCAMEAMPCRTTAFPAITVLGVLTVAGSAANVFYLLKLRGK
jgi:hypothetical protein